MSPIGPWYPWFKAAILVLLVCNSAVYAASGTVSEALDSAAWLALLIAFELETGYGSALAIGRAAAALRLVRLGAAAAILAAGIGYVHEGEWLDAANVGLWIAVVALLELEVRFPAFVARQRARFAAAAASLYCGLLGLMLAWLWQGEWFDAYDAALWIVAFAAIELNVLGFARAATGCEGG